MPAKTINIPYHSLTRCWMDLHDIFISVSWISLEDQEKTTFTCPYGTYAFIRMRFRLFNAPATF